MFDRIKHVSKISSLERRARSTDQAYADELKQMREQKKLKDDIESKTHDRYFEAQVFNDELADVKTQYLLRQANRLDIPIPRWDDEESWDSSAYIGNKFLTTQAMANLRSAIRKEKIERIEAGRVWATIIVSVLGAFTGFLSVLHLFF